MRFPRAFFAVLVAGSLQIPAKPPAAPVFKSADGEYSDNFSDASGLSLIQNVKVGHPLMPGIRVSLLEWSFEQPRVTEENSVSSLFSHPGHTLSLTQIRCPSGDPTEEEVSLWREDFGPGSQLVLGAGVSATTLGPDRNTLADFAYRPNLEELKGNFVVRGPNRENLKPSRDYTATFRWTYCDDPKCDKNSDPSVLDGVDLVTFDVYHGISLDSYTIGLPVPVNPPVDYERQISPVTLEFRILDPLPAWPGFEYRALAAMDASGGPACAPLCSATFWIESVRIRANGRKITYRPLLPKTYVCPAGERLCGWRCVPDTEPCGGDTATYYISSGSYLSPIFDSLSEHTEWTRIMWNVNQNVNNIYPRTPVGIKWRVGNSLDPETWLAKPEWFTWAVPMTATRYDPNTIPGPMMEEDEYSLFANGDPDQPLKGRYFQYAADFTGRFANDRYRPEVESPYVRRLSNADHEPALKAMRLCYMPATGRVISKTICASQLLRWREASYEADLSTGGKVQVDVLDANNVPLFSNISPAFPLSGIDPKTYPCLRLRATIDNEGDPDKLPRLLSWKVEWDILTTPLQLDRNSISLKSHDAVTITMALMAARSGNLTIHDTAGQLVREIFRGKFPPGLNSWSWEGLNDKGDRVVPGLYIVALKAEDIRQVRTIAVTP